jgi:hypothetical protein
MIDEIAANGSAMIDAIEQHLMQEYLHSRVMQTVMLRRRQVAYRHYALKAMIAASVLVASFAVGVLVAKWLG